MSAHGTPITQFTYLGTRHSFANADLPELLGAAGGALPLVPTSPRGDDQ